MKLKNVAIMIVFASLYVVLISVFQPFSYGQIQVRVANSLLALVCLYGVPSILGICIGVFLGNLSSPLGIIDLVSVVPTLLGLLVIYILRKKSVLLGLLFYNIIIDSWISYMLLITFGVPFVLSFPPVFIGLSIANIGVGYPLYKAVKIRLFKHEN